VVDPFHSDLYLPQGALARGSRADEDEMGDSRVVAHRSPDRVGAGSDTVAPHRVLIRRGVDLADDPVTFGDIDSAVAVLEVAEHRVKLFLADIRLSEDRGQLEVGELVTEIQLEDGVAQPLPLRRLPLDHREGGNRRHHCACEGTTFSSSASAASTP